jgi:hypothetical protein
VVLSCKMLGILCVCAAAVDIGWAGWRTG